MSGLLFFLLCFVCFSSVWCLRADDLLPLRTPQERLVKNFYGQFRINDENLTTGALLDIPPRLMWGWGNGVDGYCGEASIQVAGIYYGNWVSQEEVRYAAGNEELLIAVNDEKAASALKYVYEEWDYYQRTPQESAFIAEIKASLDQGIPVIAGWYEKQPKGDPDYDHIMPIVGYTADTKGAVASLYSMDLYLDTIRENTVSTVFQSRSGCSQSTSPKQPYTYCLPESVDYALIISGNQDTKKETYRAILVVDRWDEPDWGKEDGVHDDPVPLNFQLKISGLTAGKAYSILRFDTAKALPTNSFLKASYAKRYDFTATDTEVTYDQLDEVLSDGTYFYRVVANTALDAQPQPNPQPETSVIM